jgi:hypothetical protein
MTCNAQLTHALCLRINIPGSRALTSACLTSSAAPLLDAAPFASLVLASSSCGSKAGFTPLLLLSTHLSIRTRTPGAAFGAGRHL